MNTSDTSSNSSEQESEQIVSSAMSSFVEIVDEDFNPSQHPGPTSAASNEEEVENANSQDHLVIQHVQRNKSATSSATSSSTSPSTLLPPPPSPSPDNRPSFMASVLSLSWLRPTFNYFSSYFFWPFVGGIMYGLGEVCAREFVFRKLQSLRFERTEAIVSKESNKKALTASSSSSLSSSLSSSSSSYSSSEDVLSRKSSEQEQLKQQQLSQHYSRLHTGESGSANPIPSSSSASRSTTNHFNSPSSGSSNFVASSIIEPSFFGSIFNHEGNIDHLRRVEPYIDSHGLGFILQ